MRKAGLEKAIDTSVVEFTEFIVEAVRGLPLEELAELRGEELVVKPTPDNPVEHVEPPEPSDDRLRQTQEPLAKPKKTHPKCFYPGCNKNRFVRGHGYCGKHWRWWKKGKIGAAELDERRSSTTPRSELLAVKEIAALLELPEHTIRRLYKDGKLPGGTRLGPRKLLFTRVLVEEWAQSEECKQAKHRRARRAWKAKAV